MSDEKPEEKVIAINGFPYSCFNCSKIYLQHSLYLDSVAAKIEKLFFARDKKYYMPLFVVSEKWEGE